MEWKTGEYVTSRGTFEYCLVGTTTVVITLVTGVAGVHGSGDRLMSLVVTRGVIVAASVDNSSLLYFVG